MMRSLVRLVRSVLPVDLYQLLPLIGLTFLIISFGLPWLPEQARNVLPTSAIDRFLGIIALSLIRLSCCIGIYLCLVRTNRSAKSVGVFVVLPAVLGTLGISALCGQVVFAILGTNPNLPLLWWVVTHFGPGFRFAFLGTVVLFAFLCRVYFRHSFLPLSLPSSSIVTPQDPRNWDRWRLYLWVLLSLVNTVVSFLPGLDHLGDIARHAVGEELGNAAGVLFFHSVLISLAFWLLGRSTWNTILTGLSVPGVRYFALPFAFAIGAAIPICIGTALLSGRWLGIAVNAPIWSIAWVISAFGEEVIFRGILQPRFVTRYGVIRGLVLLSIAFAAWHVEGDFAKASDLTELLVIVVLFGRLVTSVGLCFVAGWLTLRSGSILPAVITHVLFNVLASLLPSSFVVALLWIALSYFLFRYMPTGSGQLPTEQRARSASVLSGIK